jgi:hypothetical protein
VSPLNTFIKTCKEKKDVTSGVGFSPSIRNHWNACLEELVFPCAAWFKQACASSDSQDGSITGRSCKLLLALQLTSEVLLVVSTNLR